MEELAETGNEVNRLNARIAELEAENDELKERVAMLDITAVYKSLGEMGHIEQVDKLNARIAELSQAVGLITILKPTMVMDANHPLDMVREVAEHVTARIAELEAHIAELEAHIAALEEAADIEEWDDFPNFPEPPEVK